MNLVIVSDTHLTPRSALFADNWRAVNAWMDTIAPDLVVHLGDITADGASNPEELDAAHATLTSGGRAMRFLPGNHDIGDNPIEPGAPTEHPLDLDRLADYRRVFGPDRWAIDAGAWQILGINAQLFATGTEAEEEQFRWLEEQLRRREGPVGLLLHKPLFRDSPRDTEAHGRYVPAAARRRLLTLLGSRVLRFVIAGHTHQSRRLHVEGVEHVWAPSTAFCIPDEMQERIGEKVVGVLRLELSEHAYRFQRVTPEGLVPHSILDQLRVYPEFAKNKTRARPTAAS